MPFSRPLIIFMMLLLAGCLPLGLEEKNDDYGESASLPKTKGAAARISQDEFNSLTPIEQYQVANKLLGALYKGIPASEFFDLTAGFERPRLKDNKDVLAEIAQSLNTRVLNKTVYATRVEERYTFNATRRATAEPLAYMHELPVSRDLLDAWIAYSLANTILFSPAEEIDSADYVDVKNVYDGLFAAIGKDAGIREIILTHMKSEANWRRFRSPEDNTREMIEIYLGLFDRDADVPKASIACKNWYITDNDLRYQLVIDRLNENTEPQKVLDQWVTTCEDFYQHVANHPLVIPRIITVLVDHFFPTATADVRTNLVRSIAAIGPTRFQDIFLAILFSREYLINNEKAKNIEEAYFNLAARVHWKSNSSFFSDLTNTDLGATFPNMHKMQQPAMTLKLGRWKDQPLDSLSFAYFHQAIRQFLLLERKTDEFSSTTRGWSASFIKSADFLSQKDYIDYLFVSVVGRKANEAEHATFNQLIVEKEIEENKLSQTMIILDYLSRLPELYFVTAKN